MTAREEVLAYALSFADVYTERPFRDQNWQLVRVKESKKAFLWHHSHAGYQTHDCRKLRFDCG